MFDQTAPLLLAKCNQLYFVTITKFQCNRYFVINGIVKFVTVIKLLFITFSGKREIFIQWLSLLHQDPRGDVVDLGPVRAERVDVGDLGCPQRGHLIQGQAVE